MLPAIAARRGWPLVLGGGQNNDLTETARHGRTLPGLRLHLAIERDAEDAEEANADDAEKPSVIPSGARGAPAGCPRSGQMIAVSVKRNQAACSTSSQRRRGCGRRGLAGLMVAPRDHQVMLGVMPPLCQKANEAKRADLRYRFHIGRVGRANRETSPAWDVLDSRAIHP